jgi:hypothetical protein
MRASLSFGSMKKFLTILHTIGLICACVSVPFAILIALRYQPHQLVSVPVTNSELVSVLLTGLTIILGVVALVIAGLALWGYHAIRDEAKTIATRTARAETRKRVVEYLASPTGSGIVENEVAKRFDELKEGLALAESYSKSGNNASIINTDADSGSKVGKPYRKKGGRSD